MPLSGQHWDYVFEQLAISCRSHGLGCAPVISRSVSFRSKSASKRSRFLLGFLTSKHKCISLNNVVVCNKRMP